MSNLLIVESDNDKYFIEALIKNLNQNIEIDTPICSIDDYECLGGIGKLEHKLNELRGRVAKEDIRTIGVIFDADQKGVIEQTNLIQEKIDKTFTKTPIVDFKIYIMHIDGKGELETVLKEIKSKESTIADCLESWQDCLSDDKKITKKEFDKFWVQIYQRYDCCSKKEKKQAGKKCNNKISFSKDIYNLDSPILKDLKSFIQDIGEPNE